MEGEVEEDGVTQEEEHHGVEVGADHLVPGADEVVQAVRQVLPHHHLPHPLQRPAEGKVLPQQLKGHPQNSTFVLKSKLVAGVKYVSSFGRFSLYLWRCGEGELWTGHFSRISFSQAQHRLCRMHLKLYFKVKRRLGYFYVCKPFVPGFLLAFLLASLTLVKPSRSVGTPTDFSRATYLKHFPGVRTSQNFIFF